MKNITPKIQTAIAVEFINEFKSKNQIVAEVTKTEDVGYEFSTGKIYPTGNMMGMIKSMSIQFTFGKIEKNGLSVVHVQWKYENPSGGTNGYNEDYVIFTENRWAESMSYKSYITKDQYMMARSIVVEELIEE